MTESEQWVVEWFRARKQFDKGSPVERLRVDYFQAELLDSFGVMELIADIEAHFGVRFEDRHFQDRRFSTLGGLARIVDELNPRWEGAA